MPVAVRVSGEITLPVRRVARSGVVAGRASDRREKSTHVMHSGPEAEFVALSITAHPFGFRDALNALIFARAGL